ncbi:MAG: hypothetical protein NT051_01775 [Candidatus Micrarchaeota archaeon]|nr:hypothetical protein [Candidatus Micrarchaeota archaeon]
MNMLQHECQPGKEFVFRTPDGKEMGRAKSVPELFARIKAVPLASVIYHTNGRHFSPWLEMLGEHSLSMKFKAVSGNDEKVRMALLRLHKQ